MSQLELRIDSAGPRHFLAGRPVPVGTHLEVELGGTWQRGRFEWSFRADERPRLITGAGEIELGRVPLRWPAEPRIADQRLALRALAQANELRDRARRWREIANDMRDLSRDEAVLLLRTKWCDDWGAEPPPAEEFLRYAEAHEAAANVLERATRQASGRFAIINVGE